MGVRPRYLKAIVFDFDGLILDTEEPVYRSWLEVYQAHDTELPFDRWIQIVGSSTATFDPRLFLEAQLGRRLEQEVLDRRVARRSEMVLAQPVMAGVAPLIESARAAGLRIGVASSSTCDWVRGHLERLGLLPAFDCIRCRDDVAAVKPAPDLYLAVLACLDVPAGDALALEDSPNGIAAAKAAGMWCVAVPNVITGGLDLSQADLMLPSLDALPAAGLARKLGLTLWGAK